MPGFCGAVKMTATLLKLREGAIARADGVTLQETQKRSSVSAVSAILCPVTSAARAGETNTRIETVRLSPPSDIVLIATWNDAGLCGAGGFAATGAPCAITGALPPLNPDPPPQ